MIEKILRQLLKRSRNRWRISRPRKPMRLCMKKKHLETSGCCSALYGKAKTISERGPGEKIVLNMNFKLITRLQQKHFQYIDDRSAYKYTSQKNAVENTNVYPCSNLSLQISRPFTREIGLGKAESYSSEPTKLRYCFRCKRISVYWPWNRCQLFVILVFLSSSMNVSIIPICLRLHRAHKTILTLQTMVKKRIKLIIPNGIIGFSCLCVQR